MKIRSFLKVLSWDMVISIALLLIWTGCEEKNLDPGYNHITSKAKTYCNPLDIDYTYTVVTTSKGVSYRSGADPAVVRHNNEFFMFVTRSHGYWHSKDMRSWTFIRPARWYFESSNAPGAWSVDSALLVLANPSGTMSLISASDPLKGNWQAQPSVIPLGIRDPGLFVDENGATYLYEGSSNLYPIVGIELDPENYYLPKGELKELLRLQPDVHGWERFGENHRSQIDPFIEGPWMTKHKGTYYLQYAAPGTQWNTYADGVYVGDHPLGPFEYAPYNPVSYKPGGFARGAGHGSTVQDNQGNYWYFGTMRITVNDVFERRIGMFPAGFDDEGQMYVNTAYGDYPHYLPGEEVEDHRNRFTGWMLLSYKKPVRASSVKEKGVMKVIDESEGGWMLPLEDVGYGPNNTTDENIRTFWVAKTNKADEWLEIDLQENMTVHAAQINYHDYNAGVFGKPDTLYHQFAIEYSTDQKTWDMAADYTRSKRDQPNAYIEFESPIVARFVRFKNKHVPIPHLAISGFRLFGKGPGQPPASPTNFTIIPDSDRRNVHLSWAGVETAQGYVLYWGINKEKLNHSAMIYDSIAYDLRSLNVDQDYYFALESFNENGISGRLQAE